MRVAFILNLINPSLRSKGVLFSIHDEDIPVFRLLRLRAPLPGLIEDARDVLLKLFDADADIRPTRSGRHLRRPGKGQQPGAGWAM